MSVLSIMAQLYQKSLEQQVQTNNLFFGVWMRWRALTLAERLVCAQIILVPAWWVAGLYKYMAFSMVLCIALYEWLRHREIRLKSPMLPVVALLTFSTYLLLKVFLHYYEPGRPSIANVVLLWFCPAFLLWYIQSNNIKIRLEVVAWACTVSVVQMLSFWFLIQFVLPESLFKPARLPTFLALLTGKGVDDGGDFFLAPFETSSGNVAGLYRLSLFFISAQFFGLVVGVIGLIALEIKNRFWSLLLFSASVFLIVLSTTRSIWVIFPIVVGLRYLLKIFGKSGSPPIIFTLMALASFTTLSIPSATNLFLDKFTDLTQSVDEFRAGSTDQRMEIYRQTWKAIQENLLWGHATKGEPLSLAGEAWNVVGSHSVILGDLLYMNGFVGTGIFVVFWISLFVWLYKTREGRPLTCVCVLILYTLVSPTMGALYGMPLSSLMILLCAAIGHPQQKNPSLPTQARFRNTYA